MVPRRGLESVHLTLIFPTFENRTKLPYPDRTQIFCGCPKTGANWGENHVLGTKYRD